MCLYLRSAAGCLLRGKAVYFSSQASLSLVLHARRQARAENYCASLSLPVVEPPIIVLIHEVLPIIGDVDAAAHAGAVVQGIAGGLIDIAGRVIVGWRHIRLSALVRALCARLLSQLHKSHGLRSTVCHTVDNTCKGGGVRVSSIARLVTRTVLQRLFAIACILVSATHHGTAWFQAVLPSTHF